MSPNPPNETMHIHQIGPDESPSYAVVRAVSTFSDTPITELDPLSLTIDPEAMDSVLESASDGDISFSYSGFDVTVTDGEVVVKEV